MDYRDQKIQDLEMKIAMLAMSVAVLADVLQQVDDKIGGPRTTSQIASKLAGSLSPNRKRLGKMDIESMIMQAKNSTKPTPTNLNIPDGINEDGTPWMK